MQAEAPVLDRRSFAILARWTDVEAVIRDMETFSNRRGRGARVDAAAGAMARPNLMLRGLVRLPLAVGR